MASPSSWSMGTATPTAAWRTAKMVRHKPYQYFGKVPLCNHRADRGIFVHGFCLPLCARCTGLLAGGMIGTAVMRISKQRIHPLQGLLIGIAMMIPTAADGAREYVSGYESTNQKRLITGFMAGFGCAVAEQGIRSFLPPESAGLMKFR